MGLIKILFVEDLQTDYELAQWHLRKDDLIFDSICVDTKQEFINALDDFQPDLIISDYSMPEFNGLQALQITLQKNPEIPFIVLTGSINEETAVQCLQAGAVDYVLKEKMHRLPFSVRETLKRDQERKEKLAAERQLRESEEKFRVIFESANVGKAITTATETISVNDALANMLGYTKEELIKIPWEKLTYPDDYPGTRDQAEALYEGKIDSVRYEKRYMHKEGSPVWVDISVKTHRNSDGKVEYIFSTIIDISEKKKAEENLRASEEQYRLLIENQNDMIVKVDAEGRFLYVSPSYCRKFGKSEEELLGEKFALLVHEEDLPDTLKAMETLNQPPYTCYFEQRAKTKDGWKWLSWTDTAVLDDEGNIKEIIGLGSDISERKQAEKAFKELNELLNLFIHHSPIYAFIKEVTELTNRVIIASENYIDMIGIPGSEMAGKTMLELFPTEFAEKFMADDWEVVKSGQVLKLDEDMNGKFYTSIKFPIQQGEKTLLAGYTIDLTERKQAELALQEKEKRYRSLFEDSPIAIFEEDFSQAYQKIQAIKKQGVTDFRKYFIENPEKLMECIQSVKILDVNHAAVTLFKANNKNELLFSLADVVPEKPTEYLLEEFVNIAEGKTHFQLETINEDFLGNNIYLSINLVVVSGYETDFSKVNVSVVDISDRKKTEMAIQESEKRYRSLFDDSPVSIWEEDFSAVKIRLDELRKSGIINFGEYFSKNRSELMKFAELIVVKDVNQETIKLFGANSKEALRESFTNIYTKKSLDQLEEELIHIANGETHFEIDFTNKTLDGRVLEFTAKWATQPGYEKDLSKVLISMIDITDRKKAEEALRENEQRYRSLFDDSPIAIFEEDFSAVKIRIDELKLSGINDFYEFFISHPDELASLIHLIKIMDINKEAEKLYGVQSKTELIRQLEGVANPFNYSLMVDEMVNIAEGLTKFQTEVYKLTEDGEPIYLNVNWSAVPGFEHDLSKVIVTVVDITERKELEKRHLQRLAELEAIDKITTALREASSKEEALPIFLQETLTMIQVEMGSIWLYQKSSDTLRVSHAIGCQKDNQGVEIKPGEGIVGFVFLDGKTYSSSDIVNEFETHPCLEEPTKEGMGGICVPIQSQEEILGVILILYPKGRDVKTDEVRLLEAFARIAGITLQRMTLYEDTLSHLKQLQVQRAIDQTIASIFDLNLTLEIICSHARNYLGADATGILLFHPQEVNLHYVAGNGFRTNQYKNTRISLGAGPAGKAALSREIIHVADLHHSDPPFKSMFFINEERFISYLAVPLIAKGELKGVMEIFYHSETGYNSDKREFIESLAFQTAIAIDNLQLFENLQLSNQELVQAYDATIEGWSRAMDLRDKETEDHTRRVTEMAVRIARIIGVEEEEIIHIRRGALLHDIGKMGVPDEILHKPGPLTPEEWLIMKRHPVFAYEMIAPIDYLKPALDIPYTHHEKWDGSGYPRGLHGEQIPLAGRIFAVIDVWDALSSDRPYRKAWPKQKVLEYIKEQSDTHFDPEIVKIFLEFVDSEDWSDEFWSKR